MRSGAALALGATLGLGTPGVAEELPVPGGSEVVETPEITPSWPWWMGELELATSVDWSRGDYGDPVDTDLLHVPVQLRYLFYGFGLTPTKHDFFELGASLPYLSVDGPAEIFFEESGELAARKEKEDGLGDLRLFATWLYAPEPESTLPAAEWSVSWKIPTASRSRGLGTGEHDVSLELALSKTLGAFSPFASLGYRFLGDSDDFSLRSGPFATLGLGYRPIQEVSVGLLYAYTRASLPSRDDAHELIPYASWRVSRDFRVEPYASARITGYAPDVGAGVRFRYFVPVR
ncbi:MAG: hypothetical protein QNK05_21715 [Myxococcota bacterium]|nr:hypothetical protein [Myxococcota bacterium]